MQPFDTEPDDVPTPAATDRKLVVGAIADLPPGACARIELPDGDNVAVYNVNGEFYAIEDCCPHRGAPLSEGSVCGHVVECGLHGWEFDVRTGYCLTVADRVKTYRLQIEDGLVKVMV